MKLPAILASCTLLCALGCGGQDGADCDAAKDSCQLKHDYGATMLAAGVELSAQCYSWTLNNPTDLWVNAVELVNDGAYHHSNWFFVPDLNFQHEDGVWKCDELHFSELNAALLGGVLFAQSTQSRAEVQRFPGGAVVRVPAWSRIIGNVHLLNASNTAVATGLRMTISTVPPSTTAVKLAPFRLGYYDLHIPPQQDSEFSATCDFRKVYEDQTKAPYKFRLYYILPHYHVLGDLFRLQVAGGPRDGQVLHELRGGFGEANGRAFDPPVDLSDSQGLTFTCGFHNPRDKEVRWGIGDQEMCEMLGFAETPIAYDAGVEHGQATGERASTALNSGSCGVRGFVFDP